MALRTPPLAMRQNGSNSKPHFPSPRCRSFSPPHKIHCMLSEAVSGPSGTRRATLQHRQHIIILSACEHSRNSFVSGPRAVILPQTSRVKMILTQVIVSLQALTSSFGYNYLSRSGILSTFVTTTPTLPNEINLSYLLRWIFFLPVTDLIHVAQQSNTSRSYCLQSWNAFFAEWTNSRLIYVSGPQARR